MPTLDELVTSAIADYDSTITQIQDDMVSIAASLVLQQALLASIQKSRSDLAAQATLAGVVIVPVPIGPGQIGPNS